MHTRESRSLDPITSHTPVPPVVIPMSTRRITNSTPLLFEPFAQLASLDDVVVHLYYSSFVLSLGSESFGDHVVLADLFGLDPVVVDGTDARGVEPDTKVLVVPSDEKARCSWSDEEDEIAGEDEEGARGIGWEGR